jgi:hypothetical protein
MYLAFLRHPRRPRRDGPPAPPARPRVEPLEDRWLLSTIAGMVYHDANLNGIHDPGETPIAGNTIQLFDATGALVDTRVTDAQGRYAFTLDPRLPTFAATKEVDANFETFKTDATKVQQVDQFDPSLGTLTAVEIINNGLLTSHIKLESLDGAPSTVTGTVAGTLTLHMSGLDPIVTGASDAENAAVGAFDGALDFAGASGHDFGDHSAVGSKSVVLDARDHDLSAFVGTGKLTLAEEGKATSSATGSGNLVSQISSQAAAQVRIIYHYTTGNGLAPGQYTLVQPQDPPGYVDGLDTPDNIHPIPGSNTTDRIPVTLTPAGSPNNNFGEVKPASLSGYVYLDANRDGIMDAGEQGIGGVTINLAGTNDLGQAVSLTKQTGADGSYRFDGLRPGVYTLSDLQPAGYLPGALTVGSLGGLAAGNQLQVAVPSGGVGFNYNFGELLPLPPPTGPNLVPPPDAPGVTPVSGLPSKWYFIGNVWERLGLIP